MCFWWCASSIVFGLHVVTIGGLWGCVQTSIMTEGFRSLGEGEAVEYFVETGSDGRTKAVQVTGPGGSPPQVHPLHNCYLVRIEVDACCH